MTRPKLILVVTEDWYFWSHRLPLAEAARDAGYEVLIAARMSEYAEAIAARGMRPVPLSLRREGRSPRGEWKAVRELVRIYRAERPDVVHHVAMKPVLYGTLAARWTGVPRIVNAFAGLGYVFTQRGVRGALWRPFVAAMLRRLLRTASVRVIVQNPDDRDTLLTHRLADQRAVAMIRGSGVDLTQFAPAPLPPLPAVVTCVTRMLWDKGVGEFVQAARVLRTRGRSVRCVLVGDTDPANPSAVPRRQLEAWATEGVVEWWGHRRDVPAVLAQSHVVCLPSYREGLPKVLIEAAAAGRPIVTTDVPGCREVVRDGWNGVLVVPRNAEALADGLDRVLLASSDDWTVMGARGRALAEAEFSTERVTAATLALYREGWER